MGVGERGLGIGDSGLRRRQWREATRRSLTSFDDRITKTRGSPIPLVLNPDPRSPIHALCVAA